MNSLTVFFSWSFRSPWYGFPANTILCYNELHQFEKSKKNLLSYLKLWEFDWRKKQNKDLDLSSALPAYCSIIMFRLFPTCAGAVLDRWECEKVTRGSNVCSGTKTRTAQVRDSACQLDKYNVSPIKNSLPFSNSSSALLTMAWQGGSHSASAPAHQHLL